jgi:hypothetical protein
VVFVVVVMGTSRNSLRLVVWIEVLLYGSSPGMRYAQRVHGRMVVSHAVVAGYLNLLFTPTPTISHVL